MKVYDVIVIGAGPAGLSAGLYAGRAKLDTLIIEKQKYGGQIVITSEIENYPGLALTNGYKLAEGMERQATSFGAKIEFMALKSLEKKAEGHFIAITDGDEIEAKAVIIATGADHRHLGAKGEEENQGKGVSYCATCEVVTPP